MAHVYIELPPGWGPGQLIKAACSRAGYTYEEHVVPGDRRWLVLRGPDPQRHPARPIVGRDRRPGAERPMPAVPPAPNGLLPSRRTARAPAPTRSARPEVPPVVRYTITGSPAFLIRWERPPHGRGWAARIIWVEITSEGLTVRGGVVPADRVRKIAGQDYRRVRRDPRPRDDSDPRDPGHRDANPWPVPPYQEDPDY